MFRFIFKIFALFGCLSGASCLLAANSPSYPVFFDSDPPTVELSTPSLYIEGDFPVNIVFSEPVTGLEIGDFNISNGAGSDLTGSGDTYSFTVSPGTFGGVAIFLPAEVAFDTAGNGNLVSNYLLVNFEPIDTIPPIVELETTTDMVHGNFIVESYFSETVEGLELSDFEITNGVPVSMSGNGSVYTVVVEPIAEGEITIQLPGAMTVDNFGNPNEPSNVLVVNYSLLDVERPSPTITVIDDSAEDFRVLAVSFDETVTDLNVGDLLLENAVLENVMWNGGVYTMTVVPLGEGTVMVQVPENIVADVAGNPNMASELWVWEYVVTPLVNELEPFFEISASREGDDIVVTWQTNTEATNAYFELKHATDLINFQTIDTQESRDTINELNTYQFSHNRPPFGTNNYFLRIFDANGNYTDSEIVTIDFEYDGPAALIYPNPASGNWVVLNTTPYAGTRCEIMIVNGVGQIYSWETYEALPYDPVKLDISGFPNGIYAVQFWIKETDSIAEKFLVQR